LSASVIGNFKSTAAICPHQGVVLAILRYWYSVNLVEASMHMQTNLLYLYRSLRVRRNTAQD